MKSISTLILFIIGTMCAMAQPQAAVFKEPDYNKRKIFSDFPERTKMRMNDMEALLQLPVGANVNLTISGNIKISGKVVSKSDPIDRQVQSVVVKLNNREGSNFTFTRQLKKDGTVGYIGRIISRNTGDALEIVKEKGDYILVKKGAHDIFTE